MERKDGQDVLSSMSMTYDGNGLPVSYTDHRGRAKTFERDAFGRVVKEFLPDDTSVEYSYNAIGQVATVLDQNKNKIAFDWDRFGLGGKTTAAHQLTDYVYDESGMLSRVDSSMGGNTDRSIQYEYDNLDRISKVTYADKEVETFTYDSWGKILETTRGDKKAVFKYDFFGRLVEKTEGTLVNRYAYNAYGQRTARSTVDGDFSQLEERSYDAYGRLTGIKSGKDVVAYQYNDKNQLAIQIVNGTFIRYEYTKYGQLKKKMMDAGIPDPGADEDVAKVL
jgi:YD repeat-containing protein